MKFLIGNKCDTLDRQVTTEQGQNLAQDLGVMFMETSAKNDINIQPAFEHISKGILADEQLCA